MARVGRLWTTFGDGGFKAGVNVAYEGVCSVVGLWTGSCVGVVV